MYGQSIIWLNQTARICGLFLFRSAKQQEKGGGDFAALPQDKTDFTRFLSVSVLFATKKHHFPKKLSIL